MIGQSQARETAPSAAREGRGHDPDGDPLAHVRLAGSLIGGVSAGFVAGALGAGAVCVLIGWDAAVLLYAVWMWRTIWRLDDGATRRRARREDPSRALTDGLLLGASAASLIAVAGVLIQAGGHSGATKDLLIGLGILSVAIAWVLVQTLFTLRYARLYYQEPEGGIGFSESGPPEYSDFAYLAFTVGMTFQVSDTSVESKAMRATVLRQAWISYVFGAAIIAITINLVAGFTK